MGDLSERKHFAVGMGSHEACTVSVKDRMKEGGSLERKHFAVGCSVNSRKVCVERGVCVT